MKKKTFFRERTAKEIKELNRKRVYNLRNLVNAIDSLDPSEDVK